MIDTTQVEILRLVEDAKRKVRRFKKVLTVLILTDVLFLAGVAVPLTPVLLFLSMIFACGSMIGTASFVFTELHSPGVFEKLREAQRKNEDYLNSEYNRQYAKDNPTEADTTAQRLESEFRLLRNTTRDLANDVKDLRRDVRTIERAFVTNGIQR